jgi:hypothetical protein
MRLFIGFIIYVDDQDYYSGVGQEQFSIYYATLGYFAAVFAALTLVVCLPSKA